MSDFPLGPALLFCPADRPDRYAKALARADAVILDLEDAVDPSNRATARRLLIENPLDPDRTIVRINPHGTPDHANDLAALGSTQYRYVMASKVSSPADLVELTGFLAIALCETAAGVARAGEIAAHSAVVALMWGAEDLVASLAGTSSRFPDGRYRDVARYARSAVLIAAGAHGRAAIDTVHLQIDDVAGLAEEADDAVASGFTATACIHPSQVEVIRAAYAPSAHDVALAEGILDTAARHSGVFRFAGQMIDAPVIRHAEAVVRRARRGV